MSLDRELAIGAILGAAVSASKRHGISLGQKVIEVAGGAAAAYYGGLIMVHSYHYSVETVGAIGFFIGIVGMEIVSVLMDVTPNILRSLIARRFAMKSHQTDENKPNNAEEKP